ncbi:PD-(D/E)XK nuclease family protein, partial [Brevundimonas sp. UBA5936]
PAPTPPVERRPRSLYVTGVERWVRDPYALYARRILNLEPMERPGASAEALARGNAVHKAIERLTEDWPDLLPDDLDAVIERLLLEELGAHGFEDAAMAREAPLARNAARWLAGFETNRRARGVQL